MVPNLYLDHRPAGTSARSLVEVGPQASAKWCRICISTTDRQVRQREASSRERSRRRWRAPAGRSTPAQRAPRSAALPRANDRDVGGVHLRAVRRRRSVRRAAQHFLARTGSADSGCHTTVAGRDQTPTGRWHRILADRQRRLGLPHHRCRPRPDSDGSVAPHSGRPAAPNRRLGRRAAGARPPLPASPAIAEQPPAGYRRLGRRAAGARPPLPASPAIAEQPPAGYRRLGPPAVTTAPPFPPCTPVTPVASVPTSPRRPPPLPRHRRFRRAPRSPPLLPFPPAPAGPRRYHTADVMRRTRAMTGQSRPA